MCESRSAARRQTLAECWLVKGHSVGVKGCCDDDVGRRSGVVEVEGVAYSGTYSMVVVVLLHEQRMFVIWDGSLGGVQVAGAVLLAFAAAAAVRSQCFLMNMGMSWKARKRCVLICAL